VLEFTNRRIMVIAILLALVSAFLVYQYLNRATEPVVEETPKVQVVVAAQNIPQDTRVSSEMFKVIDIPPEYAHPQAFRSIDELVSSEGFAGITKVELYKDEQVLKTRVYHGEVTAKFSYRIPENRRALSISMNEVMAVSGLVDVGDRVDMLLTMTPTIPGAKPRTFNLLQNMEIIAIGAQIVTADDGAQHLAGTMTLSVTPEEAQMITFAEAQGTFRLALRNPVDQRELDIDPFTQDDLDRRSQ